MTDETHASIDALTARVAELSMSLDSWKARAALAEADLARVTAERDVLRGQLAEHHQADTREAADNVAAAQQRIADLEAARRDDRKFIDAQWQEIHGDHKTIAELHAQIASLNGRIRADAARIRGLEDEANRRLHAAKEQG
jgi:chromosome segregation ATPase